MAYIFYHDQQPQCIRHGAEEEDWGVFGETLRKLKRLSEVEEVEEVEEI